MQQNKRKVGGVIIMHPGQNNYGTSLQGFASVKIIESLGYELRIIKYVKHRTLNEIFTTGPLLLKSGLLRFQKTDLKNKIIKVLNKKYSANNDIRTKTVNKFKEKYFEPISDYYYGYDNLTKGSLNYDVVFVGSDQVWGPLSLYAKFYNLLFVNRNIPTFSYASSFGIAEILPWQIKGTTEYLNKIDLIGVREISGKNIVDSLSEKKATVVLDPTMLLTKEDWNKYLKDEQLSIDEPYILCYILGHRNEVRQEILKLKQITGLKVIYFRHIDEFTKKDESFGDTCPYDTDPLDFINLIKHAQYVITDSFHGSVFSILFEKKFMTFYRQNPNNKKSTHSRIDNLMEMYNLKDRIFQSNITDIFKDIDYQNVNLLLNKNRETSLSFLKKGLNLKK